MSLFSSFEHEFNTASKFMKGKSRIIPGETGTGQTSMFSNSAFRQKPVAAPSPRQIHKEVMRGIREMSSPPFKPTGIVSGSGATAKARVKLAARNAELAQKRAAAGVGRPVPGKFYSSSRPKRVGPKTAGETKVDDLFGVN